MQVEMTVQYDDSKTLMSHAASPLAAVTPLVAVSPRAAGSPLAAGSSLAAGGPLAAKMSPAAYEDGEHGNMLALSVQGGSLLAEVVAISTASSALPSCTDADEMLRVAVGLARDVIGLERVAFYMRDPSAERLLFRGAWGMGPDGAARSEHASYHELSLREGLALQNLRDTGMPALCRPRSGLFSPDTAREQAEGDGWVMVTPLFAAGHLVGVMYNDAPRPQ